MTSSGSRSCTPKLAAVAQIGSPLPCPRRPQRPFAGWRRGIAPPGLPLIRTCGTPASGSSERGFATWRTGVQCAVAGAESAPANRAVASSRRTRCWSGERATCARRAVFRERSERAREVRRDAEVSVVPAQLLGEVEVSGPPGCKPFTGVLAARLRGGEYEGGVWRGACERGRSRRAAVAFGNSA